MAYPGLESCLDGNIAHCGHAKQCCVDLESSHSMDEWYGGTWTGKLLGWRHRTLWAWKTVLHGSGIFLLTSPSSKRWSYMKDKEARGVWRLLLLVCRRLPSLVCVTALDCQDGLYLCAFSTWISDGVKDESVW